MGNRIVTIECIKATRLFALLSETYGDLLFDKRPARIGAIKAGMVHNQVADAGTEDRYVAWDINSSVGGKKKLRTATSGGKVEFSATVGTSTDNPIEEFVTDQDELEINQVRHSTSTFSVKAKKDSETSEVCTCGIKIYHRTSGGSYTFLGEYDTGDLTTSFAIYTAEIEINATFKIDERLEIRYRAYNNGAPV